MSLENAIVDVDSHVWERLDLIEEHLEPEYRGLAPRIETDERGLEYMLVEGRKPLNILLREGRFGRMSAGESIEAKRDKYLKPGAVTYEEGLELAPASHDPHERIKLMDDEKVDVSFLYPTLWLHLESECRKPEMAAVYVRAYNNYLMDFCGHYPERLTPVAHVSVMDVEEGISELHRVADMGVKAAMLSGYPLSGRSYGDPYFDPFWEAAQEIGLPITFHVVGNLHPFSNPYFENTSLNRLAESDLWFYILLEAPGVHLGLASLLAGGVFDRFPGLKIVLLETGCSWMLYWFDRADHIMDAYPGTTMMKSYPSEYMKTNIWTSMDPDEDLAPVVVDRFGAERFMWGADYPHSEGQTGAVESLKQSLSNLPEDARRKIIGENAIRLYGLS